MGGKGSGRWYWLESKMTTEFPLKIEIGFLKRHGCLQPGAEGILYDSKSGSTRVSIIFRSTEDEITLYCRFDSGSQVIQQVTSITLEHQPCHFGGYRTWFYCGKCGRRTSALYGIAGVFQCRTCHHLSYLSQRLNKIDRLINKVNGIYEKLGAANTDVFGLPPKRPRYMRRSSYQKLCEAAEKTRLQLAEAIIQRFKRKLDMNFEVP